MSGPTAEGAPLGEPESRAWLARQYARMHAEKQSTEARTHGWGCSACTPETRRTCQHWTWALTELAKHGVNVPPAL